MPGLQSLAVVASLLLPLAAGITGPPVQTYAACQRKTSNPLDGCPAGTLYVSQNDATANFSSIQAAIASLPDDNATAAHYILIGAGVYTEQLNVTRRGPLTLLGATDLPWTNASYAAAAGSANTTQHNDVQVYHNAANYDVAYPDNAYTSVLTVGPDLNATLTGSGTTGFAVPADTPFGCSDFRAYNIDFRNEYVPYSDGPALALGTGYANTGFYSCGFYSWQDTIYIGKLGNAYFYDTVVAGETDFLYGFGTLWISKSNLALRSCGGGVTAWKGTNTTFVNKYGVYIADTSVRAANASVAPSIVGKCSLGRPWNPEHRSVYLRTYLDPSILPAGYTPWSGKTNGGIGPNTTMAVYDVYGPGYNKTAELAGNVTAVWDDDEVRPYARPVDVFMTAQGAQPHVGWIDASAL